MTARPGFDDSEAFAIEVHDTAPPTLQAIEMPRSARVGDLTEFRVEAKDAIGIRRVELIVQAPDGARTSYAMTPVGDDVHSATISATMAGPHTVEVVAEDVGLPARSARLEAMPFDVDAPLFRGLRPMDIASEGRTSSTALRFEEIERGTVRAASYDVGLGRAELPPPYVVALPPAEGRYQVKLSATSFHGALWSGSWNVTLDLTPPEIREASVDDSGSPWHVRVVASEAENVTLEFETPRGVVTVPLARAGDGAFSARFPSVGEWEAARVIATDAAGNEDSRVIAPGGSDIPFLPLAIVIAASLALALARPRSR